MRELNPGTIAPPFARYAHGTVVPEGYRLIFTSGQLGLESDGSVPDDEGAQADRRVVGRPLNRGNRIRRCA